MRFTDDQHAAGDLAGERDNFGQHRLIPKVIRGDRPGTRLVESSLPSRRNVQPTDRPGTRAKRDSHQAGRCRVIGKPGWGGSAGYDGDTLAAAGGKVAYIVWIACQNPVARPSNQHHSRIDGIIHTCVGEEYASITPHLIIDRPYIYRPQQLGNSSLLACRTAPYLRDHNRAGAQLQAVELRGAQSRNHCSVIPIHRNEGARVQDESAHRRDFFGTSNRSSRSAWLNSAGVRVPCFFSQASRNFSRASARSLAAAAVASHDESPAPDLRAASRTWSPRWASNEMLILSTFIQ